MDQIKNFVHLWAVGENKKQWMEGKETQERDNFVLYENKRINIFYVLSEELSKFYTKGLLFLQGFALHATGCFKEFSSFTFGCTMRRLLPNA